MHDGGEAQASLGRILRRARGEEGMGFNTSLDSNDILAAAISQEEKLAILRNFFSEEEAQKKLDAAQSEAPGGSGNPREGR